MREWDPASITAVSDAATSRASDTRSVSDALGTEIDSVTWEGFAADAARKKMSAIRDDLNSHAAECEHVGQVTAHSADMLRQVRSNLQNIADYAAANDLHIDYATGEVSFDAPPGMTQAEIDRKVQQAHEVSQKLDEVVEDAGKVDDYLADGLDNKIGGSDDSQGDDPAGALGDDEAAKSEDDKKKNDIDQAEAVGAADGESLSDGQLDADESQRLSEATDLSPEEKAALDSGDLGISPERMAYLTGLSHSLDDKSPAEIRAILERLPTNEARAVSDALHLVGSDRIHTDVVDPNIKPGEHGYVPATGGKENLPQSIQDIFDAPLRNDPSGEWITNPDGSRTWMPPDYNKPYKYLDEYRDIAKIAQYGYPDLQRGSALNVGMLAESQELLRDFQSDVWPNYDNDWGHQNLDPTLQELLVTASNDPVAVHDAVAAVNGNPPNNQFISDLYRHDWADDGTAAGSLFPNVTDTSVRAGETMHAFDAYAGQHYQELLNMAGTQSLGEVNPELVHALGAANVPYIDDMAGYNLDGTSGFDPLDTGANANNMRGLFAVIDSDEAAGDHFNQAAANVAKAYVADYSQGLAHGEIPNGEALQAAGKLQGSMDMGEYIHQLDSGKDKYEASYAAWEKNAEWFDAAHDTAEAIPRLQEAVNIYDALPGDPLRDLFVGDPPTPGTMTPMQLRDMDDMTKTIASYLVHEKVGDLTLLGDDIVNGELVGDPNQRYVENYLSEITGHNEFPYLKWSNAYQASIYVSEGEFDQIKPPERRTK
ncbi:TPR repeat region-containing protein [Mycolicibacterium palauense]|uniref:TPR repeat region-containing protein n=1 Tax=Mycolicibacterium palauense TaxID=2034511 RepID=UPI000BFF19E1|nr:hypothetical protein [Mycolicibacterium palauense]